MTDVIRRLPVRPGAAGLALLLALAAGCGKGEPKKQPVFPVSGKVLYRGQPAPGAAVMLVPVGDADPNALRPRGVTRDDGTFELGTYAAADGAPVGEYQVSIRWRGPPIPRPAVGGEPPPADADGGGKPVGGGPADFLRERYSDPKTSGFRVRVGAQPTTLDPFDLN